MFLLQHAQLMQAIISVADFDCIGDHQTHGIGIHVAAARELGFVSRALHLLHPHGIGLLKRPMISSSSAIATSMASDPTVARSVPLIASLSTRSRIDWYGLVRPFLIEAASTHVRGNIVYEM
ncbi:MAG: hypothetical protein WBQ94_14295 [Terracidiphilus sp.]